MENFFRADDGLMDLWKRAIYLNARCRSITPLLIATSRRETFIVTNKLSIIAFKVEALKMCPSEPQWARMRSQFKGTWRERTPFVRQKW